jgi:hypothetical protein
MQQNKQDNMHIINILHSFWCPISKLKKGHLIGHL